MRRILLVVILLIVFIEPFGDSILLSYGISFENLDKIIKNIITFLFVILIIISIPKSLPKFNSIYSPVYLIILVMIFGLINGLFNNYSINAFNDFISCLPILLIFFLKKYVRPFDLYYLSKVLLIILLFKYFVYQMITLSIFNMPSWKVLMKQSPALLVCFSIFLGRILNFSKNRGDYIFLFICLFLMLVAQARMMIVSGLFIVFLNLIFSKRKSVILYIIPLFILSFYFVLKTQNISFENIWNYYSGSFFDEGLEYRNVQLIEISKRIGSNPFFGKGLGYYNPQYLDYSQFAKPYQLELDLLNFISKIGLIFTFVYIVSFSIIGYEIINKFSNYIKNDVLFIFIGVLSLFIYSLGQTFHQGYLFWFILFLFYSNFTKNSSKLNLKNAG